LELQIVKLARARVKGAYIGQQFLALAFVEEKGSYESTGRNQEPKTAAVSHAIDRSDGPENVEIENSH
jgi:hypothetical protein